MRSLKYAILGLINREPASGYDIMKEFNKELANFWSAKHSQIYPELKKLVDEGLLEFKIEITGEVLEKKIYYITEKGRNEFIKWLNKDDDLEPTPKEVFRLRMYYANHMEKEHLEELLKHQLEMRNRKYNKLKKLFDLYEIVPDTNSVAFGDYIVLEGAVLREEAVIKWLINCLGYLAV